MTNIEKLMQLSKENPDLPILPMVWGEVAWEDCRYWMASFGDVIIDEYVQIGERIFFKSTEEEEAEEEFDNQEKIWDDDLSYEDNITNIKKKLKPLWTKAIICYIGMPE